MSDEAVGAMFARELAYQYDLTLPEGRKLAELLENEVDASRILTDAAVTTAFERWMRSAYCGTHFIEHISEFIEDALDDGVDNAGIWLLRAHLAEQLHDLETQHAHLEQALARDADFGPALFDLGFLAFLEGNAGRARGLLQRSGAVGADSMVHTVTHYPELPRAARNERCPCGSGGKRKHCCGVSEAHSLADRAYWLWDKTEVWIRRSPQNGEVWWLIRELLGDDEPSSDAVRELLATPAFKGIALLDGGLLRAFLDRVGVLLPADEYELAERWLDERHAVWSVEATKPGYWLLLEDVATGERRKAGNGSVSRCTDVGEFVFGAIVPTSDGWLLPCHPICINEDVADAVVEFLKARIDPMLVASTVIRGTLCATM